MRTASTTLALFASTLFMTSCNTLTSKHPLSDPARAKVDDTLLGTWRALNEKGELKGNHLRWSARADGWMDLLYVQNKKTPYRMFTSQIKDHRFMNLKPQVFRSFQGLEEK